MAEKKLIGAAVVGQSGGPTAVINATLAGVIRAALSNDAKETITELYGMRNGIEGLMAERLVDLSERFADDADIDTLESTPAAALGSRNIRTLWRRHLPPSDEGGGSA